MRSKQTFRIAVALVVVVRSDMVLVRKVEVAEACRGFRVYEKLACILKGLRACVSLQVNITIMAIWLLRVPS